MSIEPAINGTNPTEALARDLYEHNRGSEGRPWENTNASTREKWVVRAAKVAAARVEAELAPKPLGTRSYTIGAIKLDPQTHETTAMLPIGAIVRGAMLQAEPRAVQVANQPPHVEVVVVMFEVDPTTSEREQRTFVALWAGGTIETHHDMQFVKELVGPMSGRPCFVYELVRAYVAPEQEVDPEATQ